ncbi:MAG TPA: c-type cytochrome [Candidatus Thiothrix moscowensis]|uniref:c-type cytochrome n=1 Tax=unclassified Thiothrix TaxID=2636184 RepID=UPI0025EC81BB|nr:MULTISPECIES: c-type cytochrome [unclassified Thiothrix]HRJ53487.1 c-type cytochrome [Candidatus Thiothrix moscowensis]HRJ93566.1 c-type cytochrome [Candidatus Thiothrix moscowensis]
MKKVLMLVLTGLAVSVATSVWAEGGNAEAGKTKSATCAACHGMDGNSANPEWPKLAGQHPSYIVKQLMNFKNDERKNATMAPMAKPLSDQDMADLAAYYSAQPVKSGEADQTKVALGEQIYKGGNNATGVAACAACHGPTGTGNPTANFPALKGQQTTYVKNQLNAFRKGERANDAGKMMRNIAAGMTDAEINAVAEYIAGLQ